MADDVALKLPEDRQEFRGGRQAESREIKDKIKTIKPGEDIVSGLRAVDTAGHTAGHIAIEVVSGHDALLVVGDALAHPVIAFAHPEWKPAADHHDAEQAIKTRKLYSIGCQATAADSSAITCRSLVSAASSARDLPTHTWRGAVTSQPASQARKRTLLLKAKEPCRSTRRARCGISATASSPCCCPST